MKKVGIVGWRGMVGSVLIDRMQKEKDFAKIKSYLFSTSLQGQSAPPLENGCELVLDSEDLSALSEMDIILTCQGGDYTKAIHPRLRDTGWNGLWIDAASAKRMDDDSLIVLDPVNRQQIDQGLNKGVKNFIGGNCTVSLMLMALNGLFQENLVEWMTSMTYQAASGAGARNMLELIQQMQGISDCRQENMGLAALQLEHKINTFLNSDSVSKDHFGFPLALSLLPWIDTKVETGQSREEWKAEVEANKILGSKELIPIDGTCVRVGALRCHSQAFTIKLKQSVDLATIEELIQHGNEWVELIDNEKDATLKRLTPVYASGTLKIPVGRVRKMTLGDQYLNVFTVGDQLLWGAAEPLRRTMLMAL